MLANVHLIANIYLFVPLAGVDVGVAGRMLAIMRSSVNVSCLMEDIP